MRIPLELSARSVAEAVRAVDGYAGSLAPKCRTLCKRLAEAGVEAAVADVRKDTGELAAGIHVEEFGDSSYLVVSDGDHAAFVEFGTGVVGRGTYPGELPAEWGYDERRTPSAHDEKDPTRWYYRDREGAVRSTRGQTANAYMAGASDQMRARALAIAREVFAT